jgi:hypothetical protein
MHRKAEEEAASSANGDDENAARRRLGAEICAEFLARDTNVGMEMAAGCEQHGVGFLSEPANAVTSLAFVVAAVGILLSHRHNAARRDMPVRDRQTVVFGTLVAGTGVGSFIQHGPHPDWQAYAHDLPLAAVLMFVTTDAVSDLIERELSPSWWLVPAAAMVPVIASGPSASTSLQAAMATAAIGLTLVRARRRPALRRTLITALVTAASGAAIGALSDRTSFCQADSLVQGHAVWHLLAAAALWRMAAAIGTRHQPQSPAAATASLAGRRLPAARR